MSDNLSHDEKFAVDVIRLNKATPRIEIRREWHVGGWRVVYNWRSKANLWGRFGGGWNWKVGIQAGGRTVIIDLLVASLRIVRPSPPSAATNQGVKP